MAEERTAQADHAEARSAPDWRAPLLEVRDLRKHFPIKGGIFHTTQAWVQAVDDVSLEIYEGETLGIVGESGCGKSTTARLVMQLIKPDAGQIRFDGKRLGSRELPERQYRRQVQMVFQNSYASLNPRLPISRSIAFGPLMHGVPHKEALRRTADLLEAVGLEPTRFAYRYPHHLSGGQRQRVNIARALALEPRLLILDEAVSALDKSIQAQVLNLLVDLKERFKLTYMFISHDLHVVQYISDRVLVMYLGKVVEMGPVETIYRTPQHPYTQALLSSMPSLVPGRRTPAAPLSGDPPNPISPPSGCRFRTRCPYAEDVCARIEPPLAAVGERARGQLSACLMAVPGSGHSRAPAEAPERPAAAARRAAG